MLIRGSGDSEDNSVEISEEDQKVISIQKHCITRLDPPVCDQFGDQPVFQVVFKSPGEATAVFHVLGREIEMRVLTAA